MNILIIHNIYSTRGGEESVVKMQQELFSAAGHNVFTYFRDYNEIKGWKLGRLGSLFTSIINPRAMREVKEIIENNNIDVVFIHNLFPVISPFVLRTIKRSKAKSVMFLHNYRLLCPTGLFLKDGNPCEKCTKGMREMSCILNRCEGSITGSIGYAMRSFSARLFNIFKKNVDIFAATTQFQREKLKANGFEKCRIEIVPNFTTFDAQIDSTERNGSVLYVGRLSYEKGYDFVFDLAKKMDNIEFKMAGNYDKKELDKFEIPKNVTLLGAVDKDCLTQLYRSSSALIFPTRCYESFPLTILEAGVNNLPVACSNIGASASIVSDQENGVLFERGDIDDMKSKIEKILSDKEFAKRISAQNYKICTTKYSSSEYLKVIDLL